MSTMLEKRKSEWQAEAVVKDRAEMVLTAIRRKFKQVPHHIEETILAMSDEIALKSLLETAIDSSTLEEFTEVLK